ncbi:hypothetical protein B0J12DRAFT_687357 [Macrophomina phaseolina]|uniref:Uncharacterized protein n=1 Tax=Macrophomina phaseolina TaxID=35725 RepID=A0ABQ8FTB4_9PEZI|nr:hypothetical protein B0J12DRAFT_687357 [Macrophomina phaseolina]
MAYTKGSAVAFAAASLFCTAISSPENLKAPGLSSIACSLGSGDAHFKANEDSYFSLARTIQPTDLIYAVGNSSDQSCWSVMPKDTTSSFCLKAPEGYSVDSIGVRILKTMPVLTTGSTSLGLVTWTEEVSSCACLDSRQNEA